MSIKDIENVFSEFLQNMKAAEAGVNSIINSTRDKCEKLIKEAVADAKTLERLAAQALEEAREAVEREVARMREQLRAEMERETEEELRRWEERFTKKSEEAVEALLEKVFG